MAGNTPFQQEETLSRTGLLGWTHGLHTCAVAMICPPVHVNVKLRRSKHRYCLHSTEVLDTVPSCQTNVQILDSLLSCRPKMNQTNGKSHKQPLKNSRSDARTGQPSNTCANVSDREQKTQPSPTSVSS